MAKFSKRSLDNLKGIHPNLVRLMNEAIKNTKIDFTITEGVRTAERQKELYAQGRTMPGIKVTNVDGVTKKSEHQVKNDGYGYAVDLYPFIDGRLRVTEPDVRVWLTHIANHIKAIAANLNIAIEWGGDWRSFKDFPHFQLKK